MTKNHGYETPEEGDENWHVPLNANFEQIDTGVEIREMEADRSNYEPKNGAKFLAVDTKRVYLGDGSEWQYLTTLGGIGGQTFVQSTEPDGSRGDLWVDTSGVK